jgi:hypothetical protein
MEQLLCGAAEIKFAAKHSAVIAEENLSKEDDKVSLDTFETVIHKMTLTRMPSTIAKDLRQALT